MIEIPGKTRFPIAKDGLENERPLVGTSRLPNVGNF